MAKWLLIGDPHAVVDELDDCQRLIDGVLRTVQEEKPDRIIFLGDQFHTHAIMHVEVMAFWRRAFKALSHEVETWALVGNHDMPGDGASKSHALMACEGTGVHIVDKPVVVDGVLLVPYQHRGDDFRDIVLRAEAKTVICHQTFDGSKYENGFFAQDGIQLTGLEGRYFISGHIHTPQAYGNVMYVGAPRWRSLSDAGINRALVLMDLSATPKPLKLIPTEGWCQKLVYLEDRQENPSTETLNPSWKYVIDVHGDEAFIKARKAHWAGARVRTFRVTEAAPRVSESMGIGKALLAFVDGYKPKYGTSPAILKEMVAQRHGLAYDSAP